MLTEQTLREQLQRIDITPQSVEKDPRDHNGRFIVAIEVSLSRVDFQALVRKIARLEGVGLAQQPFGFTAGLVHVYPDDDPLRLPRLGRASITAGDISAPVSHEIRYPVP